MYRVCSWMQLLSVGSKQVNLRHNRPVASQEERESPPGSHPQLRPRKGGAVRGWPNCQISPAAPENGVRGCTFVRGSDRILIALSAGEEPRCRLANQNCNIDVDICPDTAGAALGNGGGFQGIGKVLAERLVEVLVFRVWKRICPSCYFPSQKSALFFGWAAKILYTSSYHLLQGIFRVIGVWYGISLEISNSPTKWRRFWFTFLNFNCRVSFGSSKGSMVETLIYESPLQEDGQPSPIPETVAQPFPEDYEQTE